MTSSNFVPRTFFDTGNDPLPRILVGPGRYIQGPGVIDQVGHYLGLLGTSRAGILASQRGHGAEGSRIQDSLSARGIAAVPTVFGGECSALEVDARAAELSAQQLDCLIAVGGGKAVDAGKCVAHRLKVPVVIVPTLASNDAPCSALSVLYTPDGVSDVVEYFPQHPALVVVDTDVVANASERYLVAGMGDAMATWYEAKVCLNNPAARTPAGGRPTLAACAMGEICAHTLYAHGERAAASVAANRVDADVEAVTEANTLLSGIGFESGGLAVAHAMALAYTQIDTVHHNYLHGEMVAMGTLVQLVLEQSPDAKKAAEFFARVGLPVHLSQLSLSQDQHESIDTVVAATLANPIAHHMPMALDHDTLRRGLLDAHELGLASAKKIGDDAYRRLR